MEEIKELKIERLIEETPNFVISRILEKLNEIIKVVNQLNNS